MEYPVVLLHCRKRDPWQFVLLRYLPEKAGLSHGGGEQHPRVSFAAGPCFIKEQSLHRDKEDRLGWQPAWPTNYGDNTIPGILR